MTKATLKLFMLRQHQGGVPVRDKNGDIIFYSDKQVAKSNIIERYNQEIVSN